MSQTKRSPKKNATLGSGDIASNAYNNRAGAIKNLPVGPELALTNGAVQVQGLTANAADLRLAPGTLVALFNNAATVAWATMSPAAIATAPTGIANAIPLKPNDWTVLSMGENNFLRTSTATVGVYIIVDDTTFQVIPDDQAQ